MNHEIYKFGGWEYNKENHNIKNCDGRSLELTDKEARLLEFFIGNDFRILSRESIAEELDLDLISSELNNFRNVDTSVSRLRKKFDRMKSRTEKFKEDLFMSVRHKGYFFNLPVSKI